MPRLFYYRAYFLQHKSRVSIYAWFVWLLASGFFFGEYFARVAPGVMANDLMAALNVHALSLGVLSAAFYYAYIAMQLPVGSLVDRFGPHKLLTVMAALCGLSCLLFAHTDTLVMASVARFVMGFTASFAFVGALKLGSMWFPRQRFGLVAGATQALGMLGAALGEGPVSLMVTHVGWRHTMEMIGVALLLLALLIGLLVRDRVNHTPVKKEEQSSMLQGLGVVLTNPQTWVNGLVVGCLYAPTAAFAELWGPDFFQHVNAMPADVAAGAISMIFIGWGISSPCVGWLSDRIGRRKPVIIASVLASLVMLTVALYVPGLPVWAVYTLLFLYGMSNVGVATCYTVACEQNPHRFAGTSMAFANMASVIIGAIFQPVIGWVLDLEWAHKFVKGVPFYSAHDFRLAMVALPACFLLALIGCYSLKETATKTLH